MDGWMDGCERNVYVWVLGSAKKVKQNKTCECRASGLERETESGAGRAGRGLTGATTSAHMTLGFDCRLLKILQAQREGLNTTYRNNDSEHLHPIPTQYMTELIVAWPWVQHVSLHAHIF